MANDYNIYDSSSLVDLGNDFVLSENRDGGDIAISPFGDLTSVDQIDNLRSAIKRRLFTPKGALGYYAQDINGLYFIDGEYGNEAYRFLSEPISSELLNNMKDAIISCLQQEPRIAVSSVVPSIQSTAEGITVVDFIANYTILSVNSQQNIVVTFNPASGTIS